MTVRLTYAVLGPVRATLDGTEVPLGGAKARTILAALLLNAGSVVSTGSLIEILWGEEPPERALSTLQVHVSNLRKRLGDGVPTIVTRPPGYLLAAGAADLDLCAFEEGHQLARNRRAQGDPVGAAEILGEALRRWHGDGVDGIEEGDFADRSRTWLRERRLGAAEELVRIFLEVGDEAEALRLLAPLIDTAPLRESLWELQMLGLYRSGRQAEALATYRRCRDLLDEELGVDPTVRLRELEQAILRQEPALDRVGPQRRTTPVEVAETVTSQHVDAHLELPDGNTLLLLAPLRIGRHPDCGLSLKDPMASRFHAEIRPALGGHVLSDLGSSNGTRVNGQPVLHQLLQLGDQIEIGSQVLHYRARPT